MMSKEGRGQNHGNTISAKQESAKDSKETIGELVKEISLGDFPEAKEQSPTTHPQKKGSVELNAMRGAKKRRPGKGSLDIAVKKDISSFLPITKDSASN